MGRAIQGGFGSDGGLLAGIVSLANYAILQDLTPSSLLALSSFRVRQSAMKDNPDSRFRNLLCVQYRENLPDWI